MNENMEKLVDLRVKLQLAEKRYDEATEANDLDTIEAEITELKSEIAAVEKEMSEATEVTETEVKEETEEEVKEEKEEVAEETKEESAEPAEPTSEEIERSAQWKKIDKDNLNQVASYEQRGGEEIMNEELKKQLEARGKDMKEGRSVTVASSNILVKEHQSEDVATVPFKQFSNLVDLVKTRTLIGGKSYEAPFAKTYGNGGITAEGENYTETDPEFDTVKISEVKITAYTEVSEELEKLAPEDYSVEVEKNINVSMKKKLAQQVITGTGTDELVGILSNADANKCVLVTDDITIDKIGEDTLTDIIFNYGGDEEVEGVATLMLNKLDLLAFAKVRNTTNGLKEYKIDYANQTINGIPYVINSNITPLASAVEGNYVMAYGVPMHYELTAFSNVETAKSYDYKFKSGQICYKSVGFFGGNTTSYRGFIRVKKGVVTQ